MDVSFSEPLDPERKLKQGRKVSVELLWEGKQQTRTFTLVFRTNPKEDGKRSVRRLDKAVAPAV